MTGKGARGAAGESGWTAPGTSLQKNAPWRMDIGATVLGSGKVRFRIWAPKAEKMSVRVLSGVQSLTASLEKEGNGYFSEIVAGLSEGDRYCYVLDDSEERPDPASRFQPDGVHGFSQVVDPCNFMWSDAAWKGRPLEEYIIYELHVGTFTGEGTFDALIPMLGYLKDVGITAVELLPVAQFPGVRNWGYDGAYPFAPQNSYGGPDGLKKLVDASHCRGLAVILDVVYNHLGPEGNYLNDFGHYFTGRYRTPWGEAVNFDGPYSDAVRRFFIDNALYWVTEYHVDALRLDAVHGIFDFSARHFLKELADEVHRQAKRLGRRIYVIAESDLNDVRLIDPPTKGGYGLDAQWNDDFHHALHTLLTAENDGYYMDFGRTGQFEKSIRERFVYSGEYSLFLKRRHGNSAIGRPASRFVVFAQNHDQVGNRMFGERLAYLVPFESLKLAAGVVLLSPCIPLLFMGEEYGEDAPFLYFVSHSDPDLVEAVRKGRRDEFSAFLSRGVPPDPGSVETFLRSRLDHGKSKAGNHKVLHRFYRELISLRKSEAALAVPGNSLQVSALEEKKLVWMERWRGESRAVCFFNFNEQAVKTHFSGAAGTWRKLLDSADPCWNGPGTLLPGKVNRYENVCIPGRSCAVYSRDNAS